MDKERLLELARKAFQYYIARNRHSEISQEEYVVIFLEGYKSHEIMDNII